MYWSFRNLKELKSLGWSVHIFDLGSKGLHSGLLVSVWQLVENLVSGLFHAIDIVIVIVATDSTSEHHVWLHDSLALRMNSAEASVFKNTDNISFGSFLESLKGLSLETEVVINIGADVTDQPVKWSPWNEHIGRFLIALNLTKSDGTRVESWLLPVLWSLSLGWRLGDRLASLLLASWKSLGWNLLWGSLCFWHLWIWKVLN